MPKKASSPAVSKAAAPDPEKRQAKKAATTKQSPPKQAAAKSSAAKDTKEPKAAKAANETKATESRAKATKVAATAKKQTPEPAKTASSSKAPAKAPAPKVKPRGDRAAFLKSQRALLLEERQSYMSSAEALKAQADSLALEHEPGDVQFDEEGGEGGTANVDREIDLYLSAQARATVSEIDRALQKLDDGTYGICEQCGEEIPDARLEALPHAALCVSCKSGGLSPRR